MSCGSTKFGQKNPSADVMQVKENDDLIKLVDIQERGQVNRGHRQK